MTAATAQPLVIPAEAGIQPAAILDPVFAGVTFIGEGEEANSIRLATGS
jgi:hypothetical protein